ncbi:MAG: TIGR03013 family XrtA/PEP-CTERM system glycosyltransferase [Pseudomonadota bacterium]
MAYIRLFNHSFRLPPVLVLLSEWLLLVISAYLGIWLRFGGIENLGDELTGNIALKVFTFAFVLSICTHAMRVYESGLSEGHTGILLRTLVSYSLLGCSALTIIYYMMPSLYLGRGVLAISVAVAMVLVSIFRFLYFLGMGDARFKRNVLVLGAGERAQRIENRVFQPDFQGNISIVGFVPVNTTDPMVKQEHLLVDSRSLAKLTLDYEIDEIVVALDGRRQSDAGYFPEAELLECKMSGISVLEAMAFYERELQYVELSELRASWMIYSEGFNFNILRDLLKRLFDIIVSLVLLLVTWPVIVIAAIAIKIEEGPRAPILFRQTRVGERGKQFELLKMRSMVTNAEQDGEAKWAEPNDSRVTKVGAIIRNTRVDELPQIYNVLRGEMSFIGPRPERPEFIVTFSDQIPFYDCRHYVKPGLMGWAQLCYPYGASTEDAENKLRYDLYYVKNHGLMLDLRILVQTIEVVLIGKGVR